MIPGSNAPPRRPLTWLEQPRRRLSLGALTHGCFAYVLDGRSVAVPSEPSIRLRSLPAPVLEGATGRDLNSQLYLRQLPLAVFFLPAQLAPDGCYPRLELTWLAGFAVALPTFFLLQLLLVPSIVLGPTRPLFEGHFGFRASLQITAPSSFLLGCAQNVDPTLPSFSGRAWRARQA